MIGSWRDSILRRWACARLRRCFPFPAPSPQGRTCCTPPLACGALSYTATASHLLPSPAHRCISHLHCPAASRARAQTVKQNTRATQRWHRCWWHGSWRATMDVRNVVFSPVTATTQRIKRICRRCLLLLLPPAYAPNHLPTRPHTTHPTQALNRRLRCARGICWDLSPSRSPLFPPFCGHSHFLPVRLRFMQAHVRIHWAYSAIISHFTRTRAYAAAWCTGFVCGNVLFNGRGHTLVATTASIPRHHTTTTPAPSASSPACYAALHRLLRNLPPPPAQRRNLAPGAHRYSLVSACPGFVGQKGRRKTRLAAASPVLAHTTLARYAPWIAYSIASSQTSWACL